MKRTLGLSFILLALVFSTIVLSGCATTESENASSRPWNNPRGWTGFPSGMNEGR
jgi:hypothetical protein